jgi:hypothetical protein
MALAGDEGRIGELRTPAVRRRHVAVGADAYAGSDLHLLLLSAASDPTTVGTPERHRPRALAWMRHSVDPTKRKGHVLILHHRYAPLG